jgi:hypothetical protein
MSLLEEAAALRDADRENPHAPAPDDLNAYCEQVVAWVRGPDAEGKVRPDMADLLEAELNEPGREGVRLPGR